MFQFECFYQSFCKNAQTNFSCKWRRHLDTEECHFLRAFSYPYSMRATSDTFGVYSTVLPKAISLSRTRTPDGQLDLDIQCDQRVPIKVRKKKVNNPQITK